MATSHTRPGWASAAVAPWTAAPVWASRARRSRSPRIAWWEAARPLVRVTAGAVSNVVPSASSSKYGPPTNISRRFTAWSTSISVTGSAGRGADRPAAARGCRLRGILAARQQSCQYRYAAMLPIWPVNGRTNTGTGGDVQAQRRRVLPGRDRAHLHRPRGASARAGDGARQRLSAAVDRADEADRHLRSGDPGGVRRLAGLDALLRPRHRGAGARM